MAKIKTTFFCQSCGAQFSKWQGQCSSCKAWNTISEELVQKPDKKDWKLGAENTTNRLSKPLKISRLK
jgi:DNA repair protein RadA/Sms